MKHKVILFSFALFILLSSCMKGDFSAQSSSLGRSLRVEGEHVTDTICLKAELSDAEAKYTFRLTSPDGDLTWEGSLNSASGIFSSPELSITEGAFFPEGDYEAILYSSEGSDVKLTYHVPKVDTAFKNSSESIGDSAMVFTYYDESGKTVADKENAARVELRYKDRYLNDITVVENL